MFTGIVEATGTITRVDPTRQGRIFEIACPAVRAGMRIGDSVAVNGVCLTVVRLVDDGFVVETVAETLARSNLGTMDPEDLVNLERAMPAEGRFDGHIVQGHVDCVTPVVGIEPEGEGARISLAVPAGFDRYLVEKGSVTIDGVSLTIASLEPDRFEIALIPHTLASTTLGSRRVGDRVNVEVDVIAKYVERLTKEHS